MTRHNADLNHIRDIQHHSSVERALASSIGTQQLGTATLGFDAVDHIRLRGIPAVGGHGALGGHIQGSRPDLLAWVERQSPHRRKL